MRVNLGCGSYYLDGWLNVDADVDVRADVHMDPVDFVRHSADQADEVYLGDYLERIPVGDAVALLTLLRERLAAGTVVSAVVAGDQHWLLDVFGQAAFPGTEPIDLDDWEPTRAALDGPTPWTSGARAVAPGPGAAVDVADRSDVGPHTLRS
ncbi:MAG TPA: hypothetical protein VFX70_21310, partial [Mycobacteriales bacterium]|nr:hypothetical protein [Mycobacteriales bacterium]